MKQPSKGGWLRVSILLQRKLRGRKRVARYENKSHPKQSLYLAVTQRSPEETRLLFYVLENVIRAPLRRSCCSNSKY
jgi:hypothetical protein